MIDRKLESFDAPYSSNIEALPRLAALHPSFAIVEKRYEHLLDVAAKMLERSNYRDTVTDRLLEDIMKQGKIQYPQARVIGLVGDSGVGRYHLSRRISQG